MPISDYFTMFAGATVPGVGGQNAVLRANTSHENDLIRGAINAYGANANALYFLSPWDLQSDLTIRVMAVNNEAPDWSGDEATTPMSSTWAMGRTPSRNMAIGGMAMAGSTRSPSEPASRRPTSSSPPGIPGTTSSSPSAVRPTRSP